MRKPNVLLAICLVSTFIFSSCTGGITIDSIFTNNTDWPDFEVVRDAPTYQWWVVSTPSAWTGSRGGIHLYEDGNGTILRTIDLPAGSIAPHALEYDGTHLWLADRNPDVPVYKIDPNSGEVVGQLQSFGGTGLASENGNFWVAKAGRIDKVNSSGEVLQSIAVNDQDIDDLAVNNGTLYYTTRNSNSLVDVVKVQINNGQRRTITENMMDVHSIAARENDYAFVLGSSICRFETTTNEMITDLPIPVDGEIVSITGGPIE